MLQAIKNKISLQDLKLDPRLALFAMALAAALLAVLVVFYLWRDNASYRPLYGAGEAYPAAEVMQVLDAEGLNYRVHPQSGQVMVREDQLGRARMLLSAKGIKVTLPPGYELFDKDEPLGTSQFVQNVRLKRSLEGELARTVMALRGVEQARVHIAQEESSSFVVSRRAPTKASVMVQLSPGYRLKPEQIAAIVNLMANGVPNLKPEDVSVVDQYGTLLSRGLDAWGGPAQSWQVVDDYRQKAVANVEEVLAPIVGYGNFRVSVTADIDFSQREETQQVYGETPRLRSEVVQSESAVDRLALGVPGSLANMPVNIPAPQPQAGGAGEEEAETGNAAATAIRHQTTRQLDYDQTITRVKYPSFILRQQSVAVVLNELSAPEGGWTPELRAQIEATVRSAVGFNEARGDLLTLSVFPFAPPAVTVEELQWWENPHVHSLLKLAAGALLSLLLLLLVVWPAVRALIRRVTQPLSLPQGDDMPALDSTGSAPALAHAGTGGSRVFSELNPLAEIPLPDPGSGLELQIEHLQMLAQNDPERVSEIIKQWIGRNERDRNLSV